MKFNWISYLIYSSSFAQVFDYFAATRPAVFNSAILRGDLKAAQELITSPHVTPNDINIAHAAVQGHSELLDLLLKDGRAYPTPSSLNMASHSGKLESVRLLLADHRIDPSANDFRAIGTAAQQGHLDIVKELVKDGRMNPSAKNNEAIIEAARMGHLDVVKYLLTLEKVKRGHHLTKALYYAVIDNNIEMAKLILSSRKVHLDSESLYPSLLEAASHGNIDIINLVISQPNFHFNDNFKTKFFAAASEEVSNLLLQKAIQSGDRNLAGHLLSSPKVDPSANNNAALKSAIESGDSVMVKLLLSDSRIDASQNNNEVVRFAQNLGKAKDAEITDILKGGNPRKALAITIAHRREVDRIIEILNADKKVQQQIVEPAAKIPRLSAK